MKKEDFYGGRTRPLEKFYLFIFLKFCCVIFKLCSHSPFSLSHSEPNLYVFFYLLCTSCVLIHRSLSHSEPVVCILLFVVYKLCISFTVHYKSIFPNLLYVFFLFVVYKLCSHFFHRSLSPHHPCPNLLYMYSFICLFECVVHLHLHVEYQQSHTA